MKPIDRLGEQRFFLKDDWLTDCLGVHCFNLCFPERGDAVSLPRNCPIFVTAKLYLVNTSLIELLLDEGFREINRQVVYQKNLSKEILKNYQHVPLPSKYRLEVEPFLPDVDMFSGLFTYDRFSFDKTLPVNWSKTIKAKWMSADDPNRKFIVAYYNNKVAGFLLFNIAKDYIIELVCLLEDYRGKGLARAMLYYLERIALENNICKLRVGTQGNNVNSISLYREFGFVFDNEKVVLHFSRGLNRL